MSENEIVPGALQSVFNKSVRSKNANSTECRPLDISILFLLPESPEGYMFVEHWSSLVFKIRNNLIAELTPGKKNKMLFSASSQN